MDPSDLSSKFQVEPNLPESQNSDESRLNDEREKRNEPYEVYNEVLEKKSKEIWDLKQKNLKLENECCELKKRCTEKEEEVLHYAYSLKEEEDKYQKNLQLKEAEVETYRKRLKEQERQYQEDLNVKHAEIERYRKRLLEVKLDNHNLQQDKTHLASRLSQEEARCKGLQEKLECYVYSYSKEVAKSVSLQEQLRRYSYSYTKLRDDFNNYAKSSVKQEEKMTNRLASVFEKRLRRDQRKVENVTEFNTPTEVQTAYKTFFEGERLDAWNAMEKALSQMEGMDIPVRFLAFTIFVTTFEEVEEAKDAVGDLLDNIIRQLSLEGPRRGQELCHKRKDGCSDYSVTFEISAKKEEIEITPDLLDYLMLSLKHTAHSCDLGCFKIEDVKRIVSKRWTKSFEEKKELLLLPQLAERVLPELDDYIKECIQLSWRLVTQVPPLQLEYSSSKFNKLKHSLSRLHNNTENTDLGQSDEIACYLWPALLEQGGKVIFPAEVFCKPASF